MRKKLIVKQEYSKECGSACLLSIVRFYGGNVSINSLIELTKTDKSGTNFYNMAIASRSIGLDSKCYKVTELTNLYNLKKPFIAQIISNNLTHFVVVYKIFKNKIIIMDPGQGKIVMEVSKFINIFTGYVMLFEPYKKLPLIKDNNYLNKDIIEMVINNKKLIFNILFLSLMFSIMICICSFYLDIVISNIINNNYKSILLISIVFINIEILKSLTYYFRNKLLYCFTRKLDSVLIINTFRKIILLPYNYYKNKTNGEIVSRINDLISVRTLINKLITNVFLDFLIMLVASIILISISLKMYLALLLIIFIYLIIFIIFKKSIMKLISLNQDNNAKLNSFMIENINGYETVKGLHLESIIENKFSKLYCKCLDDNIAYNKIYNIELLFKNFISSIGIILITYIGIIEIKNNKMTLEMLIIFWSLMGYFLEPISNFLDLSKEYYYVKNSVKRINNLLQVDSVNFDSNDKIDNLKGDIVINKLCFSHNYNNIILNNISLNIKNCEKVLILGSSGSGKSTLLKILYRYFEVPRNKVFINYYDINDCGLLDIRNNMSYVSQNEILYTDTIKNNILLDREIDYKRFIDICKITCVEEIVKEKFLGYDTILEENGANISGGQRQRIILARSLLTEKSFMLMDESFSEIDIDTERRILKNLFNYYRNTTFIIVSHRLDNLDLYDRMIRLVDGNLIDNAKRSEIG